MKYILSNLKVIFILAVMLLPSACASKEIDNIRVQEVKADVVLRGWGKKGFGEKVATTTISVITSPGHKGDIVVIRNSNSESGFTAEVYKPKPDALNPELWEFVSGDIEKTIVKQPDGRFHLSEMIDEGVRVEIIQLGGED